MSTLVLRIQQLADMEGDPSIDTTEWKALAAESYVEAYEIIADEGNRYFESVATLVTDGTNQLSEPVDQLSVIDQLELILDASTGRCRRLTPISPQQRAMLSGRIGQPRYYELVDDKYYVYPKPPSGQSITLRYIAQCPDLTGYADAATVDCFCGAGMNFVQYAAAVAAVQKSKNDASALVEQRELHRKNLLVWASNRFSNALPVWYVDDGDGGDSMPSNWSW
jgi:hypothetical protein